MARWNILTARGVDALKRDGVHADGAGLYLRVRGAARSWIFIYHLNGRRREMGLGALPGVGLANARARAQSARDVIAKGADPIAIKRAVVPIIPTFGEAADAWIEERRPKVRSLKSVARWQRLLGPSGPAATLRFLKIDAITTADVVDALAGSWDSTPSNFIVCNYVEAVFERAKAKGHRSGENPARWTSLSASSLEKPKGLSRGHHAALSYDKVPAFVARLRGRPAMAARALEFTIITAARSGETLGATWAEIDFGQRIWTVPAERMKAGREHRVPLPDAALTILHTLAEVRDGDLVFPGQRRGRPLSGMAMEMMLRRMETPVTVHGFRSSFRDWVSERTKFAREPAEMALAHRVGDATERAYLRGDLLEKRRALMSAWAGYCGSAQPLPCAAAKPTALPSPPDPAADPAAAV